MSEGLVSEAVQSGVEAGNESDVVAVMQASRKAKSEAAKPKPEISKELKPEAVKEPKGQPELKVEKGEHSVPTPGSEVEPKSEAPSVEVTKETLPDAVKAEEVKPEEPKEAPRYKVAIDGKEEEVSVDELRSGYMRQRDYTQKTMEHAKERETFSAQATQKRQVVDNTLNELGALSQHMVQRLVDDDQRTDWNRLKETDPEQYAVKMAERSERRELLRQTLTKANQLDQQKRYEQQEQFKTDFVQRKQDEERKLAMVVPEFADPEKSKTVKAELSKYLSERGFNKDEVSGFIDHRFIAISRDAMLYNRIQDAKRKAETEKKVEGKLPSATSAATTTGDAGRGSKVEALHSKVVKSGGNLLDVAKLLSERRKARR